MPIQPRLAALPRLRTAATTMVALVLLVACDRTPPPPSDSTEPRGKLVVTGSSSVAPLVLEIAKRYEAAHPGVRIDIQTGGSSRGLADARSGLADIGMASRALKPEESDLLGHAIARDGIGLVLHADNPVQALDEAQIVAIYTGQITNWKEVGGRDAPITVISKAEGRSTLEVFLQHFKLKSEDIRPSVVIGDNEQGIKTLVGNPDGIAYVSIGAAEYAVTHGTPIRLLPLAGVAASIENVRNGRFPLARSLILVTRAQPAGLSAAFIAYAQSAAVRDLVQQLYLVPLE